MSLTIRTLKKEDLPEISALYDSRKTVEELAWLYKNIQKPEAYNAFVAVDDQQAIIGIDAFILTTYSFDNRDIEGVTPITWLLKPNYKGIAGISLFKKVLEQSKLSIILGGSETSQELYPLFKFKKVTNISIYYKILNPIAYYRSLKNESLKKKIKMVVYLLPSCFRNASKKKLATGIELIPYDSSNYVEENSYTDVFQKKLTKPHLDMFLDCPTLTSYAYLVKQQKKFLGYCILYIDEINGVKKGRIVHLSFLGTDQELWNSTIVNCVKILKKENCCFISVHVLHDTFRNSCTENGFITINSHDTPIYLRDLNNTMKGISPSSWHLQFSEGDNAYRNL